MTKHRTIKKLLPVLSFLLTLCILTGCSLPDSIDTLNKTVKIRAQIKRLYKLSVKFEDQFAKSWQYVEAPLAEDYPKKMIPDVENARTAYAYKSENEIWIGDLSEEFAQGKYIVLYKKNDALYLLGDFYARLPVKNRAKTLKEVDAILAKYE